MKATAGASLWTERDSLVKNLGPVRVRGCPRVHVRGFYFSNMDNQKTPQKDAYYFSHDSNARHDERILELRDAMGWEGYGLYWAFIEMMRESADFTVTTKPAVLRQALSIEKDKLEEFLGLCLEFGLFVKDGERIYSESLRRRMDQMNEQREKLREAGRKGGKASQAQAGLKQGLTDAQAIKENKLNQLNKSNKQGVEDDFLSSDDFRASRPPAKRTGPDYKKICDIFAQHGLIDMVAQEFYDSFWPLYKKGEIKDWEAYTEKAALKAEQKAYGMVRGHKPDPKYNPRG